ncbi:MAG: SGNH/GDSL hydrolase family protein [Candidatus Omnitrophica bacterium]|nr:SGNH/GDSL hydrolase family protein [Candidatus Omnitrophota bacterium]MCB9720399.1 SGNH/GDSL hydrolase family protein [Candidatus Omnitrophota bacterium]
MKFLAEKTVLRDVFVIAAVSLLGLVLVLGIVDLTAYTVFGVRAPGHDAQRFFAPHPRLGTFHRPGARGFWHRYRDATRYWVEINKHGFADRERKVAKTRPRLALLGDSTAEFWEAPPEARGHEVLAEKLGKDWEVLNFGVRGYGLDQLYVLFTEEVAPFRPDIVLLHVCINDVWDNLRQSGKPYFVLDPASADGIRLEGVPVPAAEDAGRRSGWRWWLWEHSYSLRRLGLIRHPDLKAFYPLEEHFELRPFKMNYNSEDVRALSLTDKILSRLVKTLTAAGAKVLIVEMPYRPVLTEEGRERLRKVYGDQFAFDKWSAALARIAEENGVPILSLPQVIRDEKVPVDEIYHPEDQLHINARGIGVYADAVVRRLRALGWLSAE